MHKTIRDNHIKGRHLDVDAYVVNPVNFDVLETVIGESLAKVERTESWPRQISLTERQVECLTWAVRGKTSNEIAQIIGLIKRNVDFYIENRLPETEARYAHSRPGQGSNASRVDGYESRLRT